MSNSGNEQKNQDKSAKGIGSGLKKTGQIIGSIGGWIFKLRKLILAIPVAYAAVMLALQNYRQLPDEVGLILLSGGGFEQIIPRDVAVMGPLAVTALCLLLMMCSRRTLYPWLISIFSLVLPFMLMLSGLFPV